MFWAPGLGQDIVPLLFQCRYGCTGFEAEAVVDSLKNVAAVGQAVVKSAEQMEEQCAARCAERRVGAGLCLRCR